MADQPEFAEMARPYAQQLQAVGVTRVISPGSGAMVRLETGYGSVYVRYPSALDPLTFVLDKTGRSLPRSYPRPCGRRPPTIG